MILIGTMNITLTKDTGTFYCPGCSANRSYRLRTKRPFLTIYFIPTVPVGGAEPFVQCDACRATWDVSVLELDQEIHEEAKLLQFKEDALRAAILITTADGTISEREISALLNVSDKLLQRQLDRDELGSLCSSAQRLGISPANFIDSCKARWSHDQAKLVLQAAFLAASAEGELNSKQLEMLVTFKDRLKLSDLEYEQAIEDALLLAE